MTSPDSLVKPFRVLIIATDCTPAIRQAIRDRLTHLVIVEATTSAALDTAVMDTSYQIVCLQYPLPWTSMPSVTEMLAHWLPSCPILVFAPHAQDTLMYRLRDMLSNSTLAIPISLSR